MKERILAMLAVLGMFAASAGATAQTCVATKAYIVHEERTHELTGAIEARRTFTLDCDGFCPAPSTKKDCKIRTYRDENNNEYLGCGCSTSQPDLKCCTLILVPGYDSDGFLVNCFSPYGECNSGGSSPDCPLGEGCWYVSDNPEPIGGHLWDNNNTAACFY